MSNGLPYLEISPWVEQPRDLQPALEHDLRCDVVVIGGGLTGLSTALELRAQGADVALLEQDFAGSGASGRNAGHLTPSIGKDVPTLLKLYGEERATRLLGFADAAVEGYEWCFGSNELGFNFYDEANRFAHRAIRRRGAADQVNLWSNTALSLVGSSARIDLGGASVNTTCRPYHLGWILEAWSGRQHRHPGYVAS
jgi:hypothetical protein